MKPNRNQKTSYNKKMLSYVKRDKGILIVAAIFSMFNAAFSVVAPVVIGKATTVLADGYLYPETWTAAALHTVIRFLAAAAVLYAVSFLSQSLEEYIMAGVTQRYQRAIREDIVKKIDRMPVGYFESNSYGNILTIVLSDVDLLGSGLSMIVTKLGNSLVTILGIIIMMFMISPPMALVVIATVPVSAFFISRTVKSTKKYFVEQQKLRVKMNSFIDETYSGFEVVRTFAAEDYFGKKFDEINDELCRTAKQATFRSSLAVPITTAISIVGYAGVLVLGAYLAIKGKLKIGSIQTFINYVNNINGPVKEIGSVSSSYQQMLVSAERVFLFLEEAEEDDNPDDPESVSGQNGFEAIEFRDVSFGYDPNQIIIDGFRLHVDKGQKIAIVGKTGAGKSSVIKLLMRFYDVNKGAILADGKDIRLFNRHRYRANFGMVLQETWLFNGSIRDNIRFGRPEATDEEVTAAARMAYADEFISLLPGGYDYVLKEDASNISSGQKQLLTIARAFLVNSPLLILDEATSSVDTRTEKYVQSAMEDLMKGRTAFVVAHRLSTIRNADVILVMKDGNIVEQGSHDELMAQRGIYYDLYNAQFEKTAENSGT